MPASDVYESQAPTGVCVFLTNKYWIAERACLLVVANVNILVYVAIISYWEA